MTQVWTSAAAGETRDRAGVLRGLSCGGGAGRRTPALGPAGGGAGLWVCTGGDRDRDTEISLEPPSLVTQLSPARVMDGLLSPFTPLPYTSGQPW